MVELLSPTGNFECLKAAINNGANAVYLGGKNFSARAFADNFDSKEIIEAIKYAHLRNVKIYVTLNTLLNEKEFSNAIKLVDFYYENNVDALLVQDLGLYYYIKNKYPDFELHCSTQMHVHNLDGISVCKKLGFKRVVIPRESDLAFIKKACKNDIEIEVFVHGAICVSYSGQCLMSSYAKNRSANKGICAQCCRLKYELYDDKNNKVKTDTDYLLSPKDMCLIDDIPSLIEAGVSSFKIEGRLKSPAYVGYVTRLYRNAINSYYDGKKYKISNEELDNFKVLFNRNFTNDYLYNKDDLFGQKTPNHLGIKIGETIKFENNKLYIKLTKTLNQFDGIRIENFGCIVNKLYKDSLLVNHGNANDIVCIDSDTKYKGDVYKTLDYCLEKEILSSPEVKIPLYININIKENFNITVDLKTEDMQEYFHYISDVIAQKALKTPITYSNILNSFSKLNETIYCISTLKTDCENCFVSLSDLNKIRREAIDKLNDYRLSKFNRKTIPCVINFYEPEYNESNNIIQKDNVVYYQEKEYFFHDVIRNNLIDKKFYVFGDVGALSLGRNNIAYYTLNCSNSYAYEFLKKLGFSAIVVSTELKDEDIFNMINAYLKRNNVLIKPYKLIEGNRTLMYLKSNPFKKYTTTLDGYHLYDGFNNYGIIKNNDLIEIKETIENIPKNMVFSIVSTDKNQQE